jgi:hypothetical protein
VASFVGFLHLVTDPLGTKTLNFFVPKAFVIWDVGMGFATGKLLAMGA